MIEGRPPISGEQYLRLLTLAKQGAHDLKPSLGLDDAVALTALLSAWRYLDPAIGRTCQVTVADTVVQVVFTGVLPDSRVVTMPVDLIPDDAEKLSDMLGEAAEFARMTQRYEGGKA